MPRLPRARPGCEALSRQLKHRPPFAIGIRSFLLSLTLAPVCRMYFEQQLSATRRHEPRRRKHEFWRTQPPRSCNALAPQATLSGQPKRLVAECPLPGPGEKAHPAVLGRMRAADYLFSNALMTSLIAANAYDATAYRIVLEFIVSSAQLGEERKARTRK